MKIHVRRPENISYLEQYETLGYRCKEEMVEDAIEMLREKLGNFPQLSKGQLQEIENAKKEFEEGNYLTNSQADKIVDEHLTDSQADKSLTKKKVKFDMNEVLTSLELGSDEMTRYLNTETGGIAMVIHYGDSFDENGESLDSDEVEKFQDEKYVAMPFVDSREAFLDMEAFTATEKDSSLRKIMENVLQERRPFRNFKEVLQNSGRDKKFYEFQSARNHERALEWLERHNIEAVGKSES